MCRHVAYLGPPATLAELLVDPPHSLLRQSWEPKLQTSGVVNADGFGVGWYDRDRRPEPARYRAARPIWADTNFASLAALVASTAVVGIVRGATPPSPVEESSTPPFVDGRWLFAHNGAIEGFRDRAAGRLRGGMSDRRSSGIVGTSDSEVVFAILLDQLDAGTGIVDAVRTTVERVCEVAPARLNLVVMDGERVVATRCGDSLFVRAQGHGTAASVTVASEPSDDEPWDEVPPDTIVDATAATVSYTPLSSASGG